MVDVESIIEALKLGRFERVSVQVHDSHLSTGPELADRLQRDLTDSNVSLLGDSVTQCCLDEVAAEHYGCDCIVKLGHTCWFASQRMVSYFIPVSTTDPELVLESVKIVREEDPDCQIILFLNSFDEARALITSSIVSNIFICLSPCVSYPGSNLGHINWLLSRPYVSIAQAK